MRQVNLETFLRQVRKTKVDSCHLRKVVDKQIRYTIHANIIPLLQIKCGTCHCKVPVYYFIEIGKILNDFQIAISSHEFPKSFSSKL